MRKALPWIYLLLAVLGAILPWKANLEFIAEGGGQAFDLARFIADASSTAASRSLAHRTTHRLYGRLRDLRAARPGQTEVVADTDQHKKVPAIKVGAG